MPSRAIRLRKATQSRKRTQSSSANHPRTRLFDLSSEFLDELANFGCLRPSRATIQGELKEKHQYQNESAQDACLKQPACGHSIQDASNHDKRPDCSERSQHKNA